MGRSSQTDELCQLAEDVNDIRNFRQKSMMQVFQDNLENRIQVRQFLNLPFQIYRGTPQWVPSLEMDADLMLSPKRHPFYRHSQAAFYLAFDNSQQSIGRIAVIHNRNYNQYNQEKTAFFYLFECQDNPQAAHALFQAAFDWASPGHKIRSERSDDLMDSYWFGF
jgi:hypothetical protein